MTTDPHRLVCMLGVLLMSCGESSGRLLLDPAVASRDPVPSSVVAGCELAQRRCSRCHTLDRVRSLAVEAPAQWQAYVRRMRLVPASGIAAVEERPIVECLVFRSFGFRVWTRLREEL